MVTPSIRPDVWSVWCSRRSGIIIAPKQRRREGRAMKTKGINHLALVCRDMAETVEFYTKVLHMPLVKTVQLPDGGQHFFFDCGGGSLLAFFWWRSEERR